MVDTPVDAGCHPEVKAAALQWLQDFGALERYAASVEADAAKLWKTHQVYLVAGFSFLAGLALGLW